MGLLNDHELQKNTNDLGLRGMYVVEYQAIQKIVRRVFDHVLAQSVSKELGPKSAITWP
jgi:hypothetical protein